MTKNEWHSAIYLIQLNIYVISTMSTMHSQNKDPKSIQELEVHTCTLIKNQQFNSAEEISKQFFECQFDVIYTVEFIIADIIHILQ